MKKLSLLLLLFLPLIASSMPREIETLIALKFPIEEKELNRQLPFKTEKKKTFLMINDIKCFTEITKEKKMVTQLSLECSPSLRFDEIFSTDSKWSPIKSESEGDAITSDFSIGDGEKGFILLIGYENKIIAVIKTRSWDDSKNKQPFTQLKR